MTRFWITLDFASEFILESFRVMQGGELYVPKIPSMKILDLALAVCPDSKLTEIGIRPGEKLHEEMISSDDSRRTIVLRDRFVINPVIADWGYKEPDGLRMPENTPYRSDTNDQWLSRDDIKAFIANEVLVND